LVKKARERTETKGVAGVFDLGAVANGPTALSHWFECDATPERKYPILIPPTPRFEWLAGTDRSRGDVRCDSKVQEGCSKEKIGAATSFQTFGGLYLDWEF